jgi:N6-L-threonylcarbamoyladenine synthase
VRYPPVTLCTDNAAMVAAAAYFRFEAGVQSGWDLDVSPNLKLG